MAQASSANRSVAFLKIAVTAFLCYLILRNVDFTKFVETIGRVDPIFVLLSGLGYPVFLAVAAARLRWLLRGYQMQITTRSAFDVNWISGFFGNFLPSSIGGDVYRLIYLNRSYSDKPAQVVSTIILDRGLGLLATLALAAVTGTVFLSDLIQANWVIVALYCIVGVILLLSLFILFAPHGLRIVHNTSSKPISKLVNGVNILISYPDKAALVRSLVASFVLLAVTAASQYFLFLAFDSHVGPLILLFVLAVVSIAVMVPLSINGLGVTEGVAVALYSHFGFEPELILSIFLTGRILWILCAATGGIPFLLRRNTI